MSIAKAVLSGTVYRNPEKRFTGNNIPVTTFTLNIDEKEQSLIRVIARGNNADSVEQSISKGDRIAIEGRLQITAVQAENGTEKKVIELDLSSFEVIGSSGHKENAAQNANGEIVKFAEKEMDEVLIGEEEIPF
ncbi:MAG: single-stranded DNA-binding protein [Candidatus Gastranaerophilales bacterium]|nr:single-stranded DNA-binding protein [Candidatus Gastranaerophilales bacterium]